MKYVTTKDGNWVFKKDINDNIVMVLGFNKLKSPNNGYVYSRQATKEEIQKLHKAYLLANTDWVVIKGFHTYFCTGITIDEKNRVYAKFYKDLTDGSSAISVEVILLNNILEIYTKEEALEQFPEINNFINKKDMKPELKSGMIVEYNDGQRRLCVEFEGTLGLISNDNYCKHAHAMLGPGTPEIVKVYQPQDLLSLQTMFLYPGKLIWEKPKEVKELTLQEIANKFNIDVSQLRIKE